MFCEVQWGFGGLNGALWVQCSSLRFIMVRRGSLRFI